MASTSSLRDFWVWYGRQMVDLLPSSLRDAASGPADAVVLDYTDADAAVTLSRRMRGAETRLGTALPAAVTPLFAGQKSSLSLVLRLPPDLLLERDVVLPLAAERDPAAAILLNFDTLTPFSADEVYWHYEVIRRQTQGDLLHVRLSLLPRLAVAGVMAVLERAGRRPVLLEFASPGSPSRLLPLSSDPAHGGNLRRALLPVCAGLAAGVALAALAEPTVATFLHGRAIEGDIAAIQPALTKAEALRRNLDSEQAGRDALAAEHARVGDMLPILALLTAALPNDASLTELSISQRRATFSGEASGAARLVLDLSANPALSAVAFAAPVTHAISGGKDVFTIAAQIKR